jgi:D-glycero-D-manno-heptose 1,7-bisphosphate phosphatase
MRKPAPGMLLAARDELGVSLSASVLVGDKPSDIEAGRRAGVRAALLYAPDEAREALPEAGDLTPTAVIRRLEDAIGWL